MFTFKQKPVPERVLTDKQLEKIADCGCASRWARRAMAEELLRYRRERNARPD